MSQDRKPYKRLDIVQGQVLPSIRMEVRLMDRHPEIPMTPAQRLIWIELERLAGSKRCYAGSYSQIARCALVSEATVARAMRSFAEAGLVRYGTDGKDRRCGAIELMEVEP